MTEKLKQDIKEEMKLLSKESQEAINSFDWVRISEEIGKKYFLGEDEVNMLQAEIGITLVGLRYQEELASNIEDDIGTSKGQAEKMSEEIVEKILKPIFDNLSKIIKNDLKNKSIHWQQNLNFILSGGDYTAFIQRVENEKKDEIPKTNNSYDPSKLDDLKSKFTI